MKTKEEIQELITDEEAKEIRDEFADRYGFPREIFEKEINEINTQEDLEYLKATKEARETFLQNLKHFAKTEKTRELNNFEKGIKEEIERLLNGYSEVS